MSRITGELSARNIDRRQWSDLDGARHNLLLHGRGEGYVEELYFGKGFSQPPTFTYSAVFNEEQEDVLPWFLTSPRGSLTREVDQYGMGNDSQSHTGMIMDAGFESQAKYHVLDGDMATAASQIPTTNWVMNAMIGLIEGDSNDKAMWPIQRQLYDKTQFTNDWAPKYDDVQVWDDYPGPHRWIQTDDSRDLWTVDVTDGHDLGVGEAGQASAVATIGDSGYTNWLIPTDGWSSWWSVEIVDPQYQWRGFRSVREWQNTNVSLAYGGGLYAYAYPPPFLGGFKGFLYMKSDSDVELQVNATFSSEGTLTERGEPVFPDSAYYGDGWSDDVYSYRELGSVDFTHTSTGSGWQRADIELPYDGWRAWPDGHACLEERGDPKDTYWTLRFRVKGAPGTQVSLDNIYLEHELRNAEIPILTVGVDEWIRDEAGVYIGAKLWVTMGTPTGNTCNANSPGGAG